MIVDCHQDDWWLVQTIPDYENKIGTIMGNGGTPDWAPASRALGSIFSTSACAWWVLCLDKTK